MYTFIKSLHVHLEYLTISFVNYTSIKLCQLYINYTSIKLKFKKRLETQSSAKDSKKVYHLSFSDGPSRVEAVGVDHSIWLFSGDGDR